MWTWNSTRAGGTVGGSSYSDSSSESFSNVENGSWATITGPTSGLSETEITWRNTDKGADGYTESYSQQFLSDNFSNTIGTSGSSLSESGSLTGTTTSITQTSTGTTSFSFTSSEQGGTTYALTGQTQTGSTTYNDALAGPSSSSISFSFPVGIPTFTYSYSTTSTNATITATISISTTEGYNFLTTITSSATETTTGSPSTTTYSFQTTATTSSTNSEATSKTATSTTTIQAYATTTALQNVVLDTIVAADSTDWLWQVTTTGTGDLSSLGASFTRTTFSATSALATSVIGYASEPGTNTAYLTFTSATTATSTITSSTVSSFSSSYSVAVIPTTTTLNTRLATVTTTISAAVPLTGTSAATVTYTSSAATTLTYSTRASSTVSLITYVGGLGQTVASTVNETDITTFAGGTITTSFSYTIPVPVGSVFLTGTESYNAGVPTTYSSTFTSSTHPGSSYSFTFNCTNYSASVLAGAQVAAATGSSAGVTVGYTNDSQGQGSMFFATDTTIGKGWQPTPSSFGGANPIGTNINGPTAITQQALGYPQASVAVPSGTVTVGIAGAVNTTLTNQLSTTAIGGFDWSSTASTVVTQTQGILRITTCDSFSNTGTVETTFDTSHSTYSIASGQGIAAESVPMVNSSSNTSGGTPYLSFAAFPSS